MDKVRIPYLRVPCFVDGGEVRLTHSSHRGLEPARLALIQTVFEGGATLKDLARSLVERGAAEDDRLAEEQLDAAFASADSAIGSIDVELGGPYDVILVEQGYGGVYVHTVELLKKLRERWKCLLISPTRPMFEDESLPDVVTLEGLRLEQPGLSYFAWVQLVRTIVKRTPCKLLLIAHRSQSLFLFDLLSERKTVIYCDGFYDGAFRRARDFRFEDTPASRRRILAELYYLLSNSEHDFFAMDVPPTINPRLLMAGAFSLQSAVENWCWGLRQQRDFAGAFPDIQEKIKLMLPFTNPDMFRPEWVKREPRVLFTTTMHNIDKKGLPELVRAMGRLRDVQVRCVVRQPERLPRIPPTIARRFEMGSVSKVEMVKLYHRVWLNCRTSREESSPLSILESMTCEVPQIVSPNVAEQIPIMEEGKTGFIVHPDDTDRLVWALKTLLADPLLRDRTGRECRRRAIQYSFDNRVAEFERLLT